MASKKSLWHQLFKKSKKVLQSFADTVNSARDQFYSQLAVNYSCRKQAGVVTKKRHY